MNQQQWRTAWGLYAAAVELDEEERNRFLSTCGTEPEILAEVTSMVEEAQSWAGRAMRVPGSRSGSRFGRYEVGERLGSGGMGEVYAADDTELSRKVALKFLSPERTAGSRAVERLIREAKAASALNHPHIITVHEVIREKDDVAIAMELVEGRALRQFCGRPAEMAQLIHWGRQIAQALAAAHRRNIVHRDVKPENLMVRDDGILKVLDFGIAGEPDTSSTSTSTHSLPQGGTLHYMSPEQTRAGQATAASDVFSFGVVLYELAAGVHPFQSGSVLETVEAIAGSEPKAPSWFNKLVPAQLDLLLLQMLSKSPEKRPTALQIDRQLSLLDRVQPNRSSKVMVWAAVSAALGAAVLGTFNYWLRDRVPPSREPHFLQLTHQVNENRVTAAAISPDAKTLLFATVSGRVYRQRLSDGFTQPVDTVAGLRVDQLAWCDNGSKILISGSVMSAQNKYEPGIWLMSIAGGAATQIVSGGKGGVLSPDGSRIAFTSADGSILFLMSTATRERKELANGGNTTLFTSLVWSPDGERIAYQRVEFRRPAQVDPKSFLAVNDYRYDYEALNVQSGRTVVSIRDFIMRSPCYLHDGRLLFLRDKDPLGLYHLWSVRTDLRSGRFLDLPREITYGDNNLKHISASANGEYLAAVRTINGHPNIYVADLLPGRPYPRFSKVHRMTFIDADEYPHAWTPDGQSLIFESERSGNFDLFRQKINDSEAQPLVVSKAAEVLAHVSPDGKWLLFNQQRERSRWSVMRSPLAGGLAETVLPDVGSPGEFTCSVQAAGRCVVRTIQDDQFVFWSLDPLHGKGRELARTRWAPAILADWDISPDGSQVAIPNHDPRNAQIRLVQLEGRAGSAEKIVTVDGLRNLSGAIWAADGRGWYVSVVDTNRGLMFYVDLEGRVVARLMETLAPNYAVPSPDGRHIGFADWTESTNVWRVQGL